MVFSMTIGLSFVSCFSSSDSRTIKFGKIVGKGSLSESLSRYGRLEGFDEAIKYVIYSSDVLPAHLGALLTHLPQQHQGYTTEILILGYALNEVLSIKTTLPKT